ncbi:gamma-glutamyl-gamma-aminobutyrate hydrolase family protein [Microbacterium sp. RD1]|uniref:gamma-glutamyl-gamma-aminobutyrate hydrolase family protein n=1 Tax=Microbacterium sp. RD1 TaxID=3457313 RepID=UPI003FA5D0BA
MSHSPRPVIGITFSSRDLERVRFSLWQDMLRGFAEAGAATLTLDCHRPQGDLATVTQRLDGLVISGGADVDPALYGGRTDDPALRDIDRTRDDNERAALQAALDAGLPVLAICRGLQLVNVAFGGSLYMDLKRDRDVSSTHELHEEALSAPLHTVDVAPASRLSQWLGGRSGRIAVNSEHHQGIRALGAGLVASAVAEDGLIEGIESPAHPLVAVQWHPEMLWPTDENARRLLAGFVDACRADRAADAAVTPGAAR